MYTVEERNLTGRAKYHYNAAEGSSMRPNGKFPNVIKAYYSAYVPDPKYVPPPLSITATRLGTGTGTGVGTGTGLGSDSRRRIPSGTGADSTNRGDNNNSNNNDNCNNSSYNSNNNKRPYSATEIDIYDMKSNKQKLENQTEKKCEIWESKKYLGKYYIMDNITNSAIWVEVIPLPSNLLKNPSNNNSISLINVFNYKSDVNLFYFIDPRDNENCKIFKANFVSK